MKTETGVEALQKRIEELEKEIRYEKESPYLRRSLRSLVYEVELDREEIRAGELGHGINEKHGSMYEIKNQARRMADMIGLDSDMIRVMVTEAVQNIVEHGYGRYVTVRFELDNRPENPCLISSFKSEMLPGKKYLLSDINRNALKGDISSEYFDFENSRGRGEFLMKQLTDERRIVNGISINRDGEKVNYFKRILVNYKHPGGPPLKVTFHELKEEIDRLDYEDVVCLFHVQHDMERINRVTVATQKSYTPKVIEAMSAKSFRLENQETYYRTDFSTFITDRAVDKEDLLALFTKVRHIVDQEIEGR